MGSAQSTHNATSTGENKTLAKQGVIKGNVSGRPSTENTDEQTPSICEEEASDSTDDEDDDDEEWKERLAILEDARKLKNIAEYFLKPEMPVAVDATASARCYFDRPSAPQSTDDIDDQEQRIILEDLKQLKQLASHYLHPEIPVKTTDPFACGRNVFTRPSAAPTTAEECMWDDEEEEEERLRILDEAKQMKQQAVHYLQPDLPVETTAPFACGRNYFTRPSAPTNEDDGEEAIRILDEAKQMKQQVVHYLQPELPLQTTDPFACGRNYFTRPSAPTNNDNEDDKELTRILEDTKQLKQQAINYLQPELPIETTDPFACGRNYFTRPSAFQTNEEDEDDNEEELKLILEETKQLKQQAVNYLHPELPVATTDPFACGRNYFDRPSRPTHENVEEEEERAHIIHEAWELKKLADDYLHPERSVEANDPTVFGRNYFTRPSAPTQDFLDELEESARILEELENLKLLATDYLHPELPITTTDPFACSRNYFSRPSAQTPEEEEDYRANVLKDTMALKKLVADYYYPEKPVVWTDPTACGRNYFTRPSAPGPASQNTHTYCEYIDHDYHHVIDHDHHYYWYNKNENVDDDVENEGHFIMDDHEEEPFYDIKETTLEVDPFKGEHVPDFAPMKDKNEMSFLSRSPQCVLMLTWEGAKSA